MSVRRVIAQQAVEQRFDQLDRNSDGKVTRDELPAQAFFQRLDLDADGDNSYESRQTQTWDWLF